LGTVLVFWIIMCFFLVPLAAESGILNDRLNCLAIFVALLFRQYLPTMRKNIRGFQRVLCKNNVASSKRLIAIAKEMNVKCTLNSLDALHLAAACIGKANFLLTCDDEILDNATCIETIAANKGYKLKVRNPINYI
jgi:predicted nucleic acid-binding protein